MSTERCVRTSTTSPIVPEVDEFADAHVLRVQAVHEAFHQRQMASLERFDNFRGFVGIQRKRLLQKHWLARLGGPDRPFQMHRVRQRDIEGVDGGIGEQRFVAADAGAVIAA